MTTDSVDIRTWIICANKFETLDEMYTVLEK